MIIHNHEIANSDEPRPFALPMACCCYFSQQVFTDHSTCPCHTSQLTVATVKTLLRGICHPKEFFHAFLFQMLLWMLFFLSNTVLLAKQCCCKEVSAYKTSDKNVNCASILYYYTVEVYCFYVSIQECMVWDNIIFFTADIFDKLWCK